MQDPLIPIFVLLCVMYCGLSSASSVADLSSVNNAFAVDLYKTIGKDSSGTNLFFSPISISTAFGMVSLGAKGTTKQQTSEVLHLDRISSEAAVKQGYKELLTAFKDQKNNFTLSMVNRLFGSKAFQFHQQFLEDTQNYFEASLENLDFEGKPDVSRRYINSWVEEQTKQKIKDLLPDGSIDADTILVIVNAIYFKALWVIPFDEKSTKPGPFRISKSQTEDMNMMNLYDEYLSYHNSSELMCEVLELPYRGNKASMFVFLPHDVEGLRNLEKQLTGEILDETLSKVRRHNMRVQFPKFLIDQDISLKMFLQMMGMKDVFDKTKADLSGIGSGPLVVTDAIHKAFVNVSEVGTEAAAATGLKIRFMSFPPPAIRFIVDRPFLYVIYEKNTKSVLFMGRLVRPPTSKESIGKFGETAALQSNAAPITASLHAFCTVLLLLSGYLNL